MNDNHQTFKEDTYDKHVAVHLLGWRDRKHTAFHLSIVHIFLVNLLFLEPELTSHCVGSLVFRSGLLSL